MCSCRTHVPVIACILIPGFELRAALRRRPQLALEPAALAPLPGKEPLLGPVTGAAEAAGVRSAWDPRAGVAERRFAALAAASVARPGQLCVVSDERTRDFLAPLPLSLLPLEAERY